MWRSWPELGDVTTRADLLHLESRSSFLRSPNTAVIKFMIVTVRGLGTRLHNIASSCLVVFLFPLLMPYNSTDVTYCV